MVATTFDGSITNPVLSNKTHSIENLRFVQANQSASNSAHRLAYQTSQCKIEKSCKQTNFGRSNSISESIDRHLYNRINNVFFCLAFK